MKPADLAMRRALDEGAQYGRLRPLAAAANPLRPGYPETNLTIFTTRSSAHSENAALAFNTPSTPHLTLHQFRQFQHSPVPSSSPDLDYKRVRRKKSSAQLGRAPFDSAYPRPTPTSYSPPGDPSSPTSAFSPLLPPLPLTPVSRLGTKAPSLSSTVDTIQSTPTHTPISFGGPGLGQWRELEGLDLSEPLRTKRKFPLFRQAKRLPHHTAPGGGSGSGTVWEVHAAVIDIGSVTFGSGDLERSDGEGIGTDFLGESVREASNRSPTREAVSRPSGKKGRSVRFKGIENELARDRRYRLRSLNSQEEKDPSLSSSFSLSKFEFPEPPGGDLLGGLGQHSEPGSPAGPATLHYRGISFDVVNPHDSLILGSSKIETPAEIDGLLDEYFDSKQDLSTMLPYDDITGEASSSHQSSRAANSNGRQRILYNDPNSARRTIMGIQDENQPSASNESPYQDSPLANRNYRPGTPLFGASSQPRPGRLARFGLDEYDDDAPRPPQLDRDVREALRRGAATRPNGHDGAFEDVDLGTAPEPQGANGQSLGGVPQGTSSNNGQVRAVETDSSVDTHSQLSAPFPLTISDLSSAHPTNNIDEVLSGVRPSSYYASPNAAFDDRENDFHVYEDPEDSEPEEVADAQATHHTIDPDTTIGNIVNHYQYRRYPLAAERAYQAYLDERRPSPSVEAGRAYTGGQGASQTRQTNIYYNPFTGRFVTPDHNEQPPYEPRSPLTPHQPVWIERGPPITPAPLPLRSRPAPRQPAWYERGPPAVPAPLPPTSRPAPRTPQFYSSVSDLPTSEQTYDTRQLLGMTPQATSHPSNWRPAVVPSLTQSISTAPSVANSYPSIQPPHHDRSRAMTGPVETFMLDSDENGEEEEDKENTPPTTSAGNVGVGLTLGVPPTRQRSSSIYPEDEHEWSTLASDSRANFGEPLNRVRATEDRPSQESYANTSRCESDHRFSMPPPTPAVYDATGRPYEVVSRSRLRQLDSGIPYEWQNLSMTRSDARKGKMREIPQGGVVNAAMASMDPTVPPSANTNQQITDISELERLRQRESMQPRGFLGRLGQLFNLSSNKATHNPRPTVSNATQLGPYRGVHESSPSDRQGLLEYRGTPVMAGGLQFSETANTFATSPRTPQYPTEPFSPLNPVPVTPPTNAYMRNGGSINTPRANTTTRFVENTPTSQEIEMQPLRKKKPRHVSRAAMSSQTEMHPLTLSHSTTGRLTDAQLMQNEPNWTTAPDFSRTGALAHHLSKGFEFQQRDGTYKPIRMLMNTYEGRHLDTVSKQKSISKSFFEICIWCPFSAMLFGLGGLDWRIRQLTSGEVWEMSPQLKKRALVVYVPLGTIIYAAFAILVTMLAVLGK